MQETRGAALLILLLLASIAVQLGRGPMSSLGLPAFYVEKPQGVAVALGEGFPRPGIHQFSDGFRPCDVIRLTNALSTEYEASEPRLESPLQPGEMLEIIDSDSNIPVLSREWMPAGQRIALGIPLHPDRMSKEDWVVLPGLGVRKAEVIEEERQKNGDFSSLEGVGRVKGVGSRRIQAWKEFF